MKCLKYCISAILTLSLLASYAQSDTLKQFENFVVYKGDTFNLKDKNGLLQGKGLEFKLDSVYVKNGGAESSIPKKKYTYKVVGVGQYINNKKEGIWYYSSSANISHIDAEVLYHNNEIVWIDTFEKQHELVYRIENSEKGFQCYKWDFIEKRYLSVATEMVPLIKYSYNIK